MQSTKRPPPRRPLFGITQYAVLLVAVRNIIYRNHAILAPLKQREPTELEALRGLRLLIFRAYQMHAGKPTACGNSVKLIHLLRRSVAVEQDSKRAKRPKKPSAQIEMLLPIDGKKSARKS
jgi:hypothetical protein